MSNNTFKPGDKVLARWTARTDECGIAGRKFTVSQVEPANYTGPLNVRVVAADADEWWLNHADIKLRGKKEKKPLKAGDRVIVKVQSNAYQFPVGTSGTVMGTDPVAVDSPVYRVEALGDYWFYTREELKRVK